MLLKATAQVKTIQTATAMLEADRGPGRGAGLKCRGGQQAQVSGTALPQLTPSLRVILDSSNLLFLDCSMCLIHSRFSPHLPPSPSLPLWLSLVFSSLVPSSCGCIRIKN